MRRLNPMILDEGTIGRESPGNQKRDNILGGGTATLRENDHCRIGLENCL